MVFSSITFLYYFLPFFLLFYFLVPSRFKNLVLLIASILFYSWGAPMFIFIVLVSIVIDFYLLRDFPSYKTKSKKLLLSISLLLNVSILAYFKYVNFFIDNVNDLMIHYGYNGVEWVSVVLPIGISFFTFQKISYSIDIYRGIKPPTKSIIDYALYILMFPQLIAGPIVRYHLIADQIKDRDNNENTNNRIIGLFRFSIGLAKKVLIANVLGEQVDAIFSMSGNELTSSLAWIGIIAYSFQIYFDFSGYSDMAIGLGRIMGFDFPENFNFPYLAKNITEFWKRWHITLSEWMREYLYIPLGGNRVKSNLRLYVNLWVVFLISGLWHGASWTFIFWGIYHGFFLIIDRVFYRKFSGRLNKYVSIFLCYFIVLIGWVFFRSESLSNSFFYLGKMFSPDFQPILFLDIKFVAILLIAVLFSFIGISSNYVKFQQRLYRKDQNRNSLILMYILSLLLVFLSTAALLTSSFNPFIYFRF